MAGPVGALLGPQTQPAGISEMKQSECGRCDAAQGHCGPHDEPGEGAPLLQDHGWLRGNGNRGKETVAVEPQTSGQDSCPHADTRRPHRFCFSGDPDSYSGSQHVGPRWPTLIPLDKSNTPGDLPQHTLQEQKKRSCVNTSSSERLITRKAKTAATTSKANNLNTERGGKTR